VTQGVADAFRETPVTPAKAIKIGSLAEVFRKSRRPDGIPVVFGFFMMKTMTVV